MTLNIKEYHIICKHFIGFEIESSSVLTYNLSIYLNHLKVRRVVGIEKQKKGAQLILKVVNIFVPYGL